MTRVLSTYLGKPRQLVFEGREILSSMPRVAVPELNVETLSIHGDEFEGAQFHGTPDNVLYAVGEPLYSTFFEALGKTPESGGAFGENLLCSQLNEETVFCGDIFKIGTVHAQATFPRIPCAKLNFRFQDNRALKTFVRISLPGIYFRIIKPGTIRPGDSFQLLSQIETRVSIAEIYDLIVGDSKKTEVVDRLQKIENLPRAIQKRLVR